MRALPRDARPRPPAPLDDRRAALALERLPGVGPARWLTAVAGARWDAARALAAYLAGAAERSEALAAADRALAAAGRLGVRLRLCGDADYPVPLLDLPDPPPALWSLGDAPAVDGAPRVAVVGTRAASGYGLRTTRALCDALVAAGATIVSGMAAGIDGAAHHAALEAGRPTVAVLGSGPDVCFPAEHRALHRAIAAQGLVLSEHPPGTRPSAHAFPRRNRIVAALADLVIVVEAGVKSGAMITAGAALDLGRPVAAVPGPIDVPRAAGANALLRDGAHVIAGIDDVGTLLDLVRAGGGNDGPACSDAGPARTRAAAGLRRPGTAPALAATASIAGRRPAGAALRADRPEPSLPGDDARAVWRALAEPAADLDALAAAAALPAARCAAALTALELLGLAESDLTGTIVRVG